MKTLSRLSVHIMPIEKMPFATQGHWEYDDKSSVSIDIYLCKMKDWRHMALVFIHELIEVWDCIKKGITTEDCDAFDAMYEARFKSGEISIETDPGYDRKCPYHKGHVWGDRISWVCGKLLGVKWKTYCEECDELFLKYEKANFK